MNFDIDVSSISWWVDIDLFCFDIEFSSISYWIDIEYFYLRYRYFRDLGQSISNYKSFDIEFNIVSRYRVSFINARYRAFQFQYRNMPISKVRRSISNVAKPEFPASGNRRKFRHGIYLVSIYLSYGTNPVNRAFRGYMTCLPHWHLYVHAGAKLWW